MLPGVLEARIVVPEGDILRHGKRDYVMNSEGTVGSAEWRNGQETAAMIFAPVADWREMPGWVQEHFHRRLAKKFGPLT